MANCCQARDGTTVSALNNVFFISIIYITVKYRRRCLLPGRLALDHIGRPGKDCTVCQSAEVSTTLPLLLGRLAMAAFLRMAIARWESECVCVVTDC